MDITTEKTLTDTYKDITKTALILRNYDLNINPGGGKIKKDAEYLSGNRSEKFLNNHKSHGDSGMDYLKINDWSLDFLCDFILINHHKYIRKVMPKIISAGKLICGKRSDEFNLHKELTQLNNDFEFHMQKEEKLLFPYIKKMTKILNDKAEYEIPPFGSIVNLIRVIEKEHSIAVKSLSKIIKNCRSMKQGKSDHMNKKLLNEYINEFETDFHLHIHLENNILFPKAVSLEKKLKKNLKFVNCEFFLLKS